MPRQNGSTARKRPRPQTTKRADGHKSTRKATQTRVTRTERRMNDE